LARPELRWLWVYCVARLYISSTYDDLRNERDVVRKALEKIDHDAQGMESYVAADERPIWSARRD